MTIKNYIDFADLKVNEKFTYRNYTFIKLNPVYNDNGRQWNALNLNIGMAYVLAGNSKVVKL